ncbi:MAG: mechanosensitive ion channel domain-containing protein [Thermoplasmata archaeon]
MTNENKLKRLTITGAIVDFIVWISAFIIISALVVWLVDVFLPRFNIDLQIYLIYINVTLTLIFGYFLISSFANIMYAFMNKRYSDDVAKPIRNVFLIIGVGALLTVIAGEVGGGLAGVSVGGFLGIVIGYATQHTLGQAVAGLFLMFSKALKHGELVTLTGDTGIVTDIGILFTEITKDDNTIVLIPNNTLIGNKIYKLPKKDNKNNESAKQ